MRLAPLQKLLEETVAFARRERGRLRLLCREELIELSTLGLRGLSMRAQPFLRAVEPLPAGEHGGEIGLAPFRMPGRFLEFGELREEGIDEFRDPPVAIGVLRPVIGDQCYARGDRLGGLARPE